MDDPAGRSRTGRLYGRLACVAVAGVIFGCGRGDLPELGTVTGTVTENGKPLADAWIEFEPEKGRLSAGRTDVEGKYTLEYTHDAEGAIVGSHTVKIGVGGQELAGAHTSAMRNAKLQVRRQVYEKKGVAVEVGDNTLDFEIAEGNEYEGGGQ